MEGLGALGFWIFLGLVAAASMITPWLGSGAEARSKSEKERERDATLRALLEREGDISPEVLAYLRERDAAAAEAERKATGGDMSDRAQMALVMAVMVGAFAFLGGGLAMAVTNKEGEPWTVSLGLMFGTWVAGLVIAGLIAYFGSDRKKSPPPNA